MNYDGLKLCWANRRMHTANLVFGEVLYEPGGVVGPRMQRDFELVMLHSGECRVTVDAVVRDLQVGAVCLFLPGHKEHFQFSADKQTHHSYCSIRPGFMPKNIAKRLRQAPFCVPCSDVFRHLLAAAFKLRAPQDSATTLLVEQLGLCVFAEYLSACHQLKNATSEDPALAAFIHHIEDYFHRDDCLREAHRAAAISRNGLIKKLGVKMSTTPERYLWRFRAERGAAMLRETGHTAAEIAYRCGFKNPFHFSRVIKRYCGLSPRVIRRDAWSSDAPSDTQ